MIPQGFRQTTAQILRTAIRMVSGGVMVPTCLIFIGGALVCLAGGERTIGIIMKETSTIRQARNARHRMILRPKMSKSSWII
ncbi:hypothetical protein ATY42_12640 [Xanthomonas oryzae pv. oryzae]|nr:hypothetical protein ATY42_12640 [Xanthomonas oryzae pv. oryzae]AOS19442.1 hypothetical protein ATY46_12955 [Xanthomonas oryzae pv. oryzae]AOS23596.1 hypothetical protein ATY47_12895 [Xanthomonas oryzae pv. oryzae]AOS31887.1 hypothetical protein ATY49_12705 [Xanthomonas oryzae pv. oryzae]